MTLKCNGKLKQLVTMSKVVTLKEEKTLNVTKLIAKLLPYLAYL